LGTTGAPRGIPRLICMRRFLAIALLSLCGCSSHPPTVAVPPGAPAAISPDFRRDQPDQFSPQQRHLIATARRAIREAGKRPEGASDDAYYRVKRTAEGYEVFAIYVTSYKGSQPDVTPCVHNAVLLGEDGTVRKVLWGPECWP
jgi:hypothetical protein